jgi:hypothetical protein
MTMQPPRTYARIAAVIIVAAVVVAAAILVVSTYSTTSIATRSTCVSPGLGQNGPIPLRVVSDSNQAPIAGAQVTATSQALTFACNGSVQAMSQTRQTFTTNNTEWYSLNNQNNGSYSIAVEYSGQSYNFAAYLKPLSVVCASLYIPSGTTNITAFEFQSTCPASIATTTSV